MEPTITPDPIRARAEAQLAEQQELAAKLVQDLNLVRYSIQILEGILNPPKQTPGPTAGAGEGQQHDTPPA